MYLFMVIMDIINMNLWEKSFKKSDISDFATYLQTAKKFEENASSLLGGFFITKKHKLDRAHNSPK